MHFTKDGKVFTVDIKDDGVGITHEVAYGDGIENMKSRMAALCGDFNLVPSEKGLHVKLSINLESENLESSN